MGHPTSDASRGQLVEGLIGFQNDLSEHPYSVILRLDLAKAYRVLGYPDLAAGEAYKALLLIDEVVQEGEYHDEAVAAAILDGSSTNACNIAERYCATQVSSRNGCWCSSDASKAGVEFDESQAVAQARTCWLIAAYTILVGCLMDCGSLRSAHDYNTRAMRTCVDTQIFEGYQTSLEKELGRHFEASGETLDISEVSNFPNKGFVRRELYPWNTHEPDRYSAGSIQFLNEELATVAPDLEVQVASLPILSPNTKSLRYVLIANALASNRPKGRSSDMLGRTFCKDQTPIHTDSNNSSETLHVTSHEPIQWAPQLGVFAKRDILPGEEVLKEKSLLTSVSRLHDSYCDACSAPLPNAHTSNEDVLGDEATLECEECNEVFFCSVECHDLAQENYHPALCGVNVEQKVSAGEAADSLYSLLLVRALALAETRGIHPLDLKEVQYIWGDYHTQDLDAVWTANHPFGSVTKTLPFTFESNVLRPLNILEKMDVNIFEESHRFSTWVFNTLYAKFRGTASAQQGPDGRPEIGAVHPLWCLANHSCDPNVSWQWKGSIRFWAREELVNWKGRKPEDRPGIRRGEEILSHYCDVRLPVKERREWAVGALGGMCMCPRCIWEEAEEETTKGPD